MVLVLFQFEIPASFIARKYNTKSKQKQPISKIKFQILLNNTSSFLNRVHIQAWSQFSFDLTGHLAMAEKELVELIDAFENEELAW